MRKFKFIGPWGEAEVAGYEKATAFRLLESKNPAAWNVPGATIFAGDEGAITNISEPKILSDTAVGPETNQTGGGLRYDSGKPRWDLLPPEGLTALAQLYAVGARKYAERNWEKGMSWGTCFRALMSHSWKWWRGEEYDAETGTHHMICVAWNALALYTYFVRGVGKDDRPLVRKVKELWIEPELKKEEA